MSLVQQINTIIEQMPKRNQRLVLDLVKTMVSPDDILSEEDIKDIEQARAEIAHGDFVKHGDINWD
jgi:hypothetical protein